MGFNHLLTESGKDITGLVKHLDQKVIEFRDSDKYDKNTKFIKRLFDFYKQVILPWEEKYIFLNKEISEKSENHMFDEILEVISLIDNILES